MTCKRQRSCDLMFSTITILEMNPSLDIYRMKIALEPLKYHMRHQDVVIHLNEYKNTK